MAQGDWTRASIQRDRERTRRAEHDPKTCAECNPRGPATDAVMVRLAAHQSDVYGPPPAEDWGSYESNTYGGD